MTWASPKGGEAPVDQSSVDAYKKDKGAMAFWENGGIVSGVCHGPAALIGVTLSDGSSLVKGKKVACFSNAEEDVMKRRDVVPQTCEDSYKAAGADYTHDKAWADHVAVAGRLI